MVKMDVESQMYRFYEISEEIEKALENIKEVSAQQALLVKTIEESKGAEKFTSFVNSMKESMANLAAQKIKLEQRLTYMKAIIAVFEDKNTDEKKEISKVVDMIVSSTLLALGVTSETLDTAKN